MKEQIKTNPNSLSSRSRAFLDCSQTRFYAKSTHKFIKGAQEHGGELDKDHSIEWCLDAMEEEVIDQWMYVQALRRYIDEVKDIQSNKNRARSGANTTRIRSKLKRS